MFLSKYAQAFLTAPVPIVKAAAGCPVFAWMPSPMAACLYLFGPESLGGYGDLAAKIAVVAKKQNIPKTEAAHHVYLREQGAVIRVAGTPDMYDYEYHPQVVRAQSAAWCTWVLTCRAERDAGVGGRLPSRRTPHTAGR